MYDLEKNDIDISKLFNWFDKFEITTPAGDVYATVYMRIVGDAEMNRARVMSLRKSAELRKKLMDLESDERIAYVPDKEVLTRDKIIAYLAFVRTKNIYSEVSKEITVPFPKEPPSDASLERQENYQLEIDEYPIKLRKAIEEEVEKRLKVELSRFEVKNDDELYKIYVESLINDLCEAEMFDRFIDFCTYFGTYADSEMKQKYFKSQEEFLSLPSVIKKQFLRAYNTLEIDMTSLKK